MRLRTSSLLLPLAFAHGCATHNAMDATMSSWVGAPLQELVSQWGAPNGQLDIAGARSFSWNESVRINAPAATGSETEGLRSTATPMAGELRPDVVEHSCERVATVDSQGTIVSMTWSGWDCPSTEGATQNWRRRQATS